MAAHSGVLAWRIPGTRAPGGLPSMGSHRVGHDWSDLAAAAAYFSKTRLLSDPRTREIHCFVKTVECSPLCFCSNIIHPLTQCFSTSLWWRASFCSFVLNSSQINSFVKYNTNYLKNETRRQPVFKWPYSTDITLLSHISIKVSNSLTSVTPKTQR